MLLCVVVYSRLTLLKAPLAALGLLAWLLAGSACNYPKPPAAWTGVAPAPVASPAPTTPRPPPPPPLPPPPPKCEDLAENCSAGAETKLAVGDGGAWFTPPEGWHYARTATGSVAVNPDGTAMIVLTRSADPADVAPQLEAMVNERGVKSFKADKLKRRLKKPQQTLPAGEGSVDLWEVDKSQQGESLSLGDKGSGTLLALVGKPAPEQTLVGFGFVVEAVAEAEAPKIMQSVQTLRGKP